MSRKPAKPEPTPEELTARHAAMMAWIRDRKRRGYIWVTVGCLANHRISNNDERTAA